MLQCYQYSSVSGSNTSSVNTTIVQSCLNNLPEESKNNYQSMVLQSKNRISSSSCVYNNIPSSLHFLDQVTHWIIITFNFKLLNLRNIEKFVEHYWICFRCPYRGCSCDDVILPIRKDNFLKCQNFIFAMRVQSLSTSNRDWCDSIHRVVLIPMLASKAKR